MFNKKKKIEDLILTNANNLLELSERLNNYSVQLDNQRENSVELTKSIVRLQDNVKSVREKNELLIEENQSLREQVKLLNEQKFSKEQFKKELLDVVLGLEKKVKSEIGESIKAEVYLAKAKLHSEMTKKILDGDKLTKEETLSEIYDEMNKSEVLLKNDILKLLSNQLSDFGRRLENGVSE